MFHPPTEHILKVVMVDDFITPELTLGSGDHELEDLLGVDYYVSLVSGFLRQGTLTKKDIKNPNMVTSQASSIIKQRHCLDLKADELAWYFSDLVKSGQAEIPNEVRERFKKLLLELTEPF